MHKKSKLFLILHILDVYVRTICFLCTFQNNENSIELKGLMEFFDIYANNK